MAGPPRGSTRDRGRAAEHAVAEHLVAHGLEIVERNYTSAGAELDLIAREEDPQGRPVIVFVEVRSRATDRLGSPLETVDRTKQRRIIRAATAWLVSHDLWERVDVRFDVVACIGPHQLQWIRDAFQQ